MGQWAAGRFADGVVQARHRELDGPYACKPCFYRWQSPGNNKNREQEERSEGPEKSFCCRGICDRRLCRIVRKTPGSARPPTPEEDEEADDRTYACQNIRQGGAKVIGTKELDEGEGEA